MQCSITLGHDIKSQKQSDCLPGAYINYLVQTTLGVFILYSLSSVKAQAFQARQGTERKQSKRTPQIQLDLLSEENYCELHEVTSYHHV